MSLMRKGESFDCSVKFNREGDADPDICLAHLNLRSSRSYEHNMKRKANTLAFRPNLILHGFMNLRQLHSVPFTLTLLTLGAGPD